MAVSITRCAFKHCPHLQVCETPVKNGNTASFQWIRRRTIFLHKCTLAGRPPNQIYRCPLDKLEGDIGTGAQ